PERGFWARGRRRGHARRFSPAAGLLLDSAAMILTRDAIRREIDAGRVVIEPFTLDQIGPASIDLHLGDEIRVMQASRDPVPVTDDADYRSFTDVRRLDAPYALAPGETIHGVPRQAVTLP